MKNKTDFSQIFNLLTDYNIKFVLVDGGAAIVHGSARATYDVDIVYSRESDNLTKIEKAFSTINPYLRGAPPGLPFKFDISTLQTGLNFTLATDIGDIDLFGEIAGVGGYHELLPYSQQVEVFGNKCFVLGLEKLIQVKRAAGRPRDLEAIAELQSIQQEKKNKDY